MKEAIIDYRKFKLSKLNTKEFQHLKWLIFWPVYGIMFYFVEHIFEPVKWHVMQCSLDEVIPFNEWFFIPYLFWFVFVFGSLVYTLLFDREAFTNLMRFIVITYSAAILIFLIYPSCQLLRPFYMENSNFLTHLVRMFYAFDTNTNVFPSVHVIGSIAVVYGLWNAKFLNKWKYRIPIAMTAMLISVSTLFMKQHSALDVGCAAIVFLTAYGLLSVLSKIPVKKRAKSYSKNYIG